MGQGQAESDPDGRNSVFKAGMLSRGGVQKGRPYSYSSFPGQAF